MEEDTEVLLSKLVYGGDALGRLPDGQLIFVPFGLPGERVQVRIQTPPRRGPLRAEIVEILEPSPDRIEARCVHFGLCGGCHYQNMSYPAQLRAKADILRDQLVRIGGIADPPVKETVPSPTPWNYRNNVQFHLTTEGKLGYMTHPAASVQGRLQVFAISECHLPEPILNELWPELEFDPGLRMERVILRAGDELLLVLESDDPEVPEIEIGSDVSAVHLFQDNAVVLAGNPATRFEVLGRTFAVSAASFFQVNTSMAARMAEHVLGKLPSPAETILDLYCGVGLFSAFLAPGCQRLVGVESSASACADFMVNLDEFTNVELYEGLAEEILPHLDLDPDAVVLDPPRAGLDRRVLDALISRKPASVLYISCDPSTLARDAGRLVKGGYRLVEAVPFDLFPQTYHIESISVFSRA